MDMERPHNILTDPLEIALCRKWGKLLMPLTETEAGELESQSVDERGQFLQQRLDSIRNHNKAEKSTD